MCNKHSLKYPLIIRLAEQGYTVVGIELAESAAKQFFEENNFKCTQHKMNDDVIIYEVILLV